MEIQLATIYDTVKNMKLLLMLMSMIAHFIFYSGTPGLDAVVSESWDFRGYVDVNMDNIPEKIFTADNIYITDLFDKVLYCVPLVGTTENIIMPIWTVKKSNQDFSVKGSFDYKTTDGIYQVISYKIVNGKFVLYKPDPDNYAESNTSVYNGDGTVMYIGDALNRSEEDYGVALDDFNEFMSEAARLRDENGVNFTAIIDAADETQNIFVFSWNSMDAYINGEIVKDYPVSWGYDFYLFNQAKDDSEYNPNVVIVNFGPGTAQHLVPVFLTNEGKLFYPLTEYGIGQGFDYNAELKEITANDRRFGDFYDDNSEYLNIGVTRITLGGDENFTFRNLTTKPYWFYYDGEIFYEYVGEEITIDSFKKISGADEAIKKIAEKDGEITSILYRENGIYNINYHVESDTKGVYFNFYDTYRYDEELTLIGDSGWGIYLPSVLEDIQII
jgi:hypothetical protein